MRTVILVVVSTLAAPPARAQTLSPADAKAHVGQTVTVKAPVDDVHTGPGGVTFINMGGSYPDNAFTAVIFAADRAKFPDARTLKGKTVGISGEVQLYQGKPEIILKSAEQLKGN